MMELRISTKKLVSEFISLVRVDSEDSGCAGMRRQLTSLLRSRFGLKPLVLKSRDGANLLVRVPGRKTDGEKPLLLAAHMDTVSPGKGIRPVVFKDRIVSSGRTILGADDKSAIAVFLQALEILKKSGLKTRPLEILFTYGEESGLLGARSLDPSLLKAKEGLCFDAGGDFGRITVAAPFYTRYEITMTGRASHSGIAPEKGINAIKALADLVTLLPAGRLDRVTTANVGTIRGGVQNNIVPATAVATGEVRSLDRKKLHARLKAIRLAAPAAAKRHNAKVSAVFTREFAGYAFPRRDRFLQQVMETMRRMDVLPVLERHNGGSDANIFNAAGIRTLNLSIGMENVHTTAEYIRIDNLVRTLSFLLSFLTENKTGVIRDA